MYRFIEVSTKNTKEHSETYDVVYLKLTTKRF